MSEKEYQNEKVSVEVNRKENSQVELVITAKKELLDKAKSVAIKKVAKEVEIPGFRKGKAPTHLILEKQSAAVEEQKGKELANLAYVAAQELVQISPLSQQTTIGYDLENLEENEAKMRFIFEVEPKASDIDYSSFSLNKIETPKIGEKELEEAIRQMRFFFASWKEIQDRPVQEGDYILLDLESLESDPPSKVFEDTRFEVSEKGMAKWMLELVTGMNLSESKEGISRADDHLSEKEKKEFEPRKVRVTIKKIEEASLPPVDDAFAQKVGAKDVPSLHESVEKMLKDQAEEKVDKEKRGQVNLFLLKNASFDLPKSIVEDEIRHRKAHMMENPQFKEFFEKASIEEKKQFDQQLEKEAKDSVYLYFLARKVIEDNKIQITQKEIENEAVASLRASSFGHQMPDMDKIPKEVFALAFSKLMLKKAQDYILQDKEESKKEAPKKPEKEKKEKAVKEEKDSK